MRIWKPSMQQRGTTLRCLVGGFWCRSQEGLVKKHEMLTTYHFGVLGVEISQGECTINHAREDSGASGKTRGVENTVQDGRRCRRSCKTHTTFDVQNIPFSLSWYIRVCLVIVSSKVMWLRHWPITVVDFRSNRVVFVHCTSTLQKAEAHHRYRTYKIPVSSSCFLNTFAHHFAFRTKLILL